MALGEAGTISDNTTFTGEPIQVTFTEPLTDPVIALMATDLGGHKFSLRVIETQLDGDGNATGFTFTMDEWENHDGRHPRVEDINWIAVEEGVHTLPDGRIIEARHSDADGDGEPVSFNAAFTQPPVVLTTVASDNDASNVDSDPYNVTASGFDLIVEEAESQDGVHGIEQVGWIAIQPGKGADSGSASNASTVNSGWATYSTGDDFTNPITVAETQTRNDTDTGNVIWRNADAGADTIQMRFEEDTSVDGDRGHANETLGIVTFEQGLIMCFTPGTMIDTPHGPRDVASLLPGDLVLTRDEGPQPVHITSQRELSFDNLLEHPEWAPVLIRAGAFGPKCPTRDMLVSPQHRILLEGWKVQTHYGESEILAPARGLINNRSVMAADEAQVSYIHIGFETHQVITANGLPTESLDPAGLAKSTMADRAREELFDLFPRLRAEQRIGSELARPTVSVREASAVA